MTKLLIALASAGLLTLGGCASTTNSAGTTQAAAPGISSEAQAALTQAEADVAASKKAKNEWTSAADALKKAQEAAKKGDSDAALKSAKFASAVAKLSIGQLKYPSTDVLK